MMPIKECQLSFLLLLILFNICKSEVELKIKQGVLIGKTEKTYLNEQVFYAFRGIPFALPPVESLRFKPPVEHGGWDDTYEAVDNKPPCYQYNFNKRLFEEFTIFGSEDCLYLNIFSPNLQASLPVVIFEYNDDFRSGVNGTDVYSPDFFIEDDVIVVTISHRLGIFGYLTTNDDIIPPNAGLKDFLLGLRWVKDNIERFGGDPNRITIMGSRGGGALANILLYSEKAKGLFDAVIMHSGTAFKSTYFDRNPAEKAFKLAKSLKIETDDSKILLDELQKIDANSLISKDGEGVDNDLLDNYQMSIFPFSPTIEENGHHAVLTALPENAVIVNDVPVIIGMNSREGLELTSHYIMEPRIADSGNEFLMTFPIRTQFVFDRKNSTTIYDEAVKEILNFYLEEGYFYHANVLEYAVYVGDILQNYALNFAAKRLAKNLESTVFYYMFDFRGLLNENIEFIARNSRTSIKHWGATIGDDLCYLHLCKRIHKTYKTLKGLPGEPPEMKVLKKMVRLWTNFIKNRNPTPLQDELLNGFKWNPINKDSDDTNYLHITKKLQISTNPLGQREKFWDEFMDKYSKLAVDGVVKKIEEKHDEL